VALAVVASAAFGNPQAAKAASVKLDSSTLGAIEARSIGPAVMSGRISALDGVIADPRIVYVGAASGGLWKTVNDGATFKPVFDKYNQSIGAVTVDQRKPDTVWVGTGEPWTRNSVSVGDGVYKTTDAGENWQKVGLAESEHIGRIAIDPQNSDVVYVAALGHLWNAGGERGLYKTSDGGKTWERILYVDENTGCSDVAIDPQEPATIYACMWQFRRRPWSFESGGPGSGLFRSVDGGKTWEKVTAGLPEGVLGRISIGIAPSRPGTLYAAVEAKKSGIYRSDDTGRSWRLVYTGPAASARPFYFSRLLVDPKDHAKIYKMGFNLAISRDGGKSFGFAGGSYHGDVHDIWITPLGTTVWMGTDGGVYRSHDSCNTWFPMRNLPVSQFYHVSYDMQRPYNVYGGLQDNGSWKGPSQSVSGIENRDWQNVGFGDGFWTFADPADPNTVYVEWQGGRVSRLDLRTLERKAIAPLPQAGDPKLRFNWNTPIELSPTVPGTLYVGAQFLYRSADRGESWQKISPDLTTNDEARLKQEDSGGLTPDNSSAENYCTIFTISESPLDSKVVWVGTDDGNVQLTRDGGKTWKNVTANVAGLPRGTGVSCIEASHHQMGTAYATFDGHMLGDKKPYVFKTTDFGATWTALAGEPVTGFAHVVREDLVNPDLLFVGTEFGLFLSLDGGKQWARFTGKLPPVPVRDIAIHPRESDVIVATHGRGIYIIDDITPIRKLNDAVLQQPLAFLETRPQVVRFGASEQQFPGDDEFVGANLAEVAWITYYLKDRHVVGDMKIEVLDAAGKLVSILPTGKRRGINRVPWPMRMKPPLVPVGSQIEGGSLVGPVVPEGTYTVKLSKGSDTYTTQIVLIGDPTLKHSAEDRKLQQETAMRLYRMLEELAFVGESLRDLREQVRARADKLKTDALGKQLEAYWARLDTLHRTIAPVKEGHVVREERLRERIGGVYGDVSGYGGRPSKDQIDQIAVLQGELDKTAAELATLAGEIGGFNTRLAAKKLEPLHLMTREEFAKQSGR
jgi:photosystem II stability/assembly factor-like uncharacterized protein